MYKVPLYGKNLNRKAFNQKIFYHLHYYGEIYVSFITWISMALEELIAGENAALAPWKQCDFTLQEKRSLAIHKVEFHLGRIRTVYAYEMRCFYSLNQ